MTLEDIHENAGHRLVGREGELKELTAGVLDTMSGTGGLFLVLGEPGMGKSRLVEAVAEIAQRNGVSVHWGRCWEAGGAPAYWPWIQVLRSILERDDAPDLEKVPGASALGQVMPELATVLPERDPTVDLEPDQARFQLMDAVASVIRATARTAPVVVILEDLHGADPASLTLLDFLNRQITTSPVVVVGTCREGEALAEGVERDLARTARDARLTFRLQALGEDEVSELILRTVCNAADPRVVSEIHRTSEGNPFFVVEIAGLMAQRGQLDCTADGEIIIPDSIRAVVSERAEGLGRETADLLGIASVLGRGFQLSELRRIGDADFHEIEERLAEAAKIKLVHDFGDGRYEFAHMIFREYFHSGLAASRRHALHLQAAEAIEARSADDGTMAWMEYAHHLVAAGPEAGARARDACVEAAARAREQLAFDDSAELLGRAIGLLDGPEERDWTRVCELLLDRALSLIKAGRIDEGRKACLEAAGAARWMDDTGHLARAALVYGGVFSYGEVDRDLVDLLSEALEAVGPDDSADRARLQARLAAALQPAEDPLGPIQMALDAIEMARRIGDKGVLLETIRSGCSAMMDLADPAYRLVLNREHVALANEIGRPFDAFRGHMRIVADALELGELKIADDEIRASDRLARRSQLPHHLWPVACFRALRAGMKGQFDEAWEWNERAEIESKRVQDPNSARSIALQQFGLVRAQEDFEAMASMQRRLENEHAGSGFMGIFLMALGSSNLVRMGLPERLPPGVAEICGEKALVSGDPTLMAAVGEIVACSGPDELARRLLDRLYERRKHWVPWGLFGMTIEGPYTRILALLASRLGEPQQAERWFEDALGQARAFAAWPMVSRTAFEWAEHLARKNLPEETAMIATLLDEAGEVAERLGQYGLLGRMNSLRELVSAEPGQGFGVPSVQYFRLVLDGELWAFTCEGETFHLKNTKGLQLLARLVGEPGREIHVLDLVGAGSGGEKVDAGDAGEMLDETAKRQYQMRVEELQAEIEEAKSFNDPGREARAREELDAIAAELSRAFGLGGRDRRAGRAAERARVNVQRRLRDAVKRVSEQCPSAGKHLEWALKTGMYCVYDPR